MSVCILLLFLFYSPSILLLLPSVLLIEVSTAGCNKHKAMAKNTRSSGRAYRGKGCEDVRDNYVRSMSMTHYPCCLLLWLLLLPCKTLSNS